MRYKRLPDTTRARVLGCLVEGLGIRPTARAAGVAINSVQAILRDVAPRCRRNHDEKVQNLPTTRIEADEAWAFCYAREGSVPKDKRGTFGYGDVWVWSAIDPDTKIVASYMVGRRQRGDAFDFLRDLRGRLRHKIQLDTDQHAAYWSALRDCAEITEAIREAADLVGTWPPNGERSGVASA